MAGKPPPISLIRDSTRTGLRSERRRSWSSGRGRGTECISNHGPSSVRPIPCRAASLGHHHHPPVVSNILRYALNRTKRFSPRQGALALTTNATARYTTNNTLVLLVLLLSLLHHPATILGASKHLPLTHEKRHKRNIIY